MDVKGLFEYHNPPTPYPQLDTILDERKQATAYVDRTIEERTVDNLQSPRGHDALRHSTSPLSPRQPLRTDSSVDSSEIAIPSADSDPFDFFSADSILDREPFDFPSADGVLDPVNESPQERDTQARLLDLNASPERERNLLGEQEPKGRGLEQKVQSLEQRVQSLEEEVQRLKEEKFMLQILLEQAEPPAHIKNIFDEVQCDQVEKQDKSGSPEAMTLVESEPDPAPEPQVLAATPKQPISDMLDMPLVHEHPDPEKIRMEDTMSERGIKADGSTVTGDKKRKRFSFFSATKKARTSTHAPYDNMPDVLDPSTNRIDARRPIDNSDSQKNSLVHVADGDKPTISTRPTSWPRSRLFRRSAGIPVKKITEAFDKMRLQHEKSLPTAS
ncbi:MAG: hypothetical protein Q9178_004661 [Gyalolechia marmorata]